jgi:formamidopyrimidine-DNA glycosylase
MPELPEVQTVVSQLGKKVVGKTIANFWSDWKKNVLPSFSVFAKRMKDATIIGTRRLGKHVVIDLDNDHSIIIHLKMTGHLLYKTEKNREEAIFTEDRINSYIHHIFTFSDGTTLEFSDMRKFAWLRILKTGDMESLKSVAELGIDALSDNLTPKHFRELVVTRSKRTIGEVLLEQNLIAGIGNIYRSEALFLAGVRPMRLIASITGTEWKKIVPAIKTVLRKAVKLHGTTDGDFRDTDGQSGRFQRTLYVYRREKVSCKICGTIIERKKLGQRSVFFCRTCQK